MDRRTFLSAGSAAFGALSLGVTPKLRSVGPRPNVVFLTWHDAGDWFGCYGYDSVSTPGVDRLASEGARFSQSISACAICSPSRAAMMTGRVCQRNGVMGLTNTVFDQRIRPDCTHLSRRLKAEGYRTALFGVQHEAAHEHVPDVIDPDERIATDPWPNGDLLAEYVRGWLYSQRKGDGPFFAQIGTFDAHLGRFFRDEPAQPDEHYPPVQDRSNGVAIPSYLRGTEADEACVATLQGQLRRGDRVVQAVLDGLDAAGLAENTIVVMCVDHGVGLDRAKATCYEAGTRVGWVVRWPERIAGGSVIDELANHVDVTPTLLDLLGIAPEDPMDGVSFAGHLLGEAQGPIRDAAFSHMVEVTRSVRTETHRLIRNLRPTRHIGRLGDCAHQHRGFEPAEPIEPVAHHLELYDVRTDPDCLNDLSRRPEHAETLIELDRRLWSFLISSGDFCVTSAVRDEFAAETRAQLVEFCEDADVPVPSSSGPLFSPYDAATVEGRVFGG